jgi:hypothetical protein
MMTRTKIRKALDMQFKIGLIVIMIIITLGIISGSV